MRFIHRNRRPLIIGVALSSACALGTLGWILLQERPTLSKPHSNVTASPGTTSPVSKQASALVDHQGRLDPFQAGSRRRYHVDFGTTLESDKSRQDGAVGFVGSSSLVLTVAKADAERMVLHGQISNVSVTVQNAEASSASAQQQLSADLAYPFVVTIAKNGRIDTLQTAPEMNSLGHGLLRLIVSALQFVGPPDRDWRSWTSEESDHNGIYKARYEQLDIERFKKTKLEYSYLDRSRSFSVGLDKIQPKIECETQLSRNDSGVVSKVEMRERAVLPLGKRALSSDTHVTLELQQLDVGAVPVLDTSQMLPQPLFAARTARSKNLADDLESKRNLVAGATFDQLATELQQAAPSKANNDARWELTNRMSALFDVDPASVTAARAKLRGKIAREDGDMLLAALSHATTPEAQAAIASLITDQAVDPALRKGAMTQLSVLKKPTDETLNTLAKVANDVGTDPETKAAATLALGGAARASRENGAGEGSTADRAVEQLMQAADSAQNSDDQQLQLDALGNSGSSKALDAIKRGLSNDNPNVRAAAVNALRFLPPADADPLIANALLRDPDPDVRACAAKVMSYRPLSAVLLEAVAAALKAEPEIAIRVELILRLKANWDLGPHIQALIEWSEKNDAAEEVKRAAARAIQSMTQPPSHAPPLPAR